MEIKKIYFDLDGVLADFDGGLKELCNFNPVPINEFRSNDYKKNMWAAIKNVDHFFTKLKIKDGAKEIFNKVYDKYKDKVEILTGIPKPHNNILTASEDKLFWVREKLSKDIVVHLCYSNEKENYALGKEYLLIDDYQKNTTSWIKRGGSAILCNSPKELENELKKLELI